MFPEKRYRRLRQNKSIRNITEETRLSSHDFVLPLILEDGKNKKTEIPSMPDVYRYSIDNALFEVERALKLGIYAILLFAKCDEKKKDNSGKEAINPGGLMQRGISAIKNRFPELLIITDVALDPYSIYGHDGIVHQSEILNDTSIEILAEMSVSHAEAGADFVAPSDMMDGRITEIRSALDENEFENVGIMSYSVKYASSFYGPFRDALNSKPEFGDKKTYQMNPANRLEAIKEVNTDIDEGADIIMIKPGIPYLDIIREIKNQINIPVASYHVSGEYSMIKAAAKMGWLNEEKTMLECLLCLKRAGSDIIVSYYAKEAIKLIGNFSKI